MNRLTVLFRRTRARARAALIGYVTLSDPNPQAGAELLLELQHAGLDAVELGFPAYNPFLDGPLIRQAHRQALKAGATLPESLRVIARYRAIGGRMPVILMGYADVLLGYGARRFARRAAAAGVDALIVPDLSVEDASGGLLPALADQGLCMVPVYSPELGHGNVAQKSPGLGGFAYCIPSNGRSGGRAPGISAIERAVAQCRRHTLLPVCVGFGIKTPRCASLVAERADGVVVGSALIARIHQDLATPERESAMLRYPRSVRYVASLLAAVQQVSRSHGTRSVVPSSPGRLRRRSHRRAEEAPP
jgi:tryptophan synthase alpha chain